MARKAIVDKTLVLNMLKEGKTTQDVANKFGVSRQAIDLHRKEFITNGLLYNQRAPGVRTERKEVTPPELNVVSLDEHIDLIIEAFSALRRLPQLEKELEIFKRKYENAVCEIQLLQEAEQKRQNQELRWSMAQKKGINTSLAKSDEAGE
ncbi:hypothetical protein ACFLTL_02775 [Chloroflexota bacterium]